jgi:hypothetical protein
LFAPDIDIPVLKMPFFYAESYVRGLLAQRSTAVLGRTPICVISVEHTGKSGQKRRANRLGIRNITAEIIS